MPDDPNAPMSAEGPAPAPGSAQWNSEPRASEPFALAELHACLWQPQRALDVVLAERGRLVASVLARQHLPALVAVLALCGVVFAVPFGCVDRLSWVGHVPTLFVGSVLLCFPSLQVFGAYLGLRLSMAQNLAIALLIPAAAALFAFGFFPIHWFLQATMEDGASSRTIRVVLLAASLLLGLSHCNRCLFQNRELRAIRASWLLWIGWQGLVLFISYRMAMSLGLLA